ncbi:MAG: cytochrome c oxidase, coo3-type, cytochrome o subunit [Deferribacteraceae bacterium]|jgi:cytochrome c oxidase subunit 1|nr:cytochrome c oxidase, coo3-type, cytochrome o subunit [Deferribacteraceae bacterium]
MNNNSEVISFLKDNKYPGIFGWIFSTDHKRIGLLYMYSTLLLFIIGVIIGLLIRIELIAPGKTIVGPQTYNAFFTVHGVIMIF